MALLYVLFQPHRGLEWYATDHRVAEIALLGKGQSLPGVHQMVNSEGER